MIRRIPVVATIIVLLAAATMVGLGIWQIGRAHEKEALLAQYRAAMAKPAIAFPTAPFEGELPLFRKAHGMCLKPVVQRQMAGRNHAGDPGYVFVVGCSTGAEGPGMAVEIGWSQNPNAKFQFTGGEVSGRIVPDSRNRMRLVSDTPAPGLQASEPPSIEDIPNNHRSYAVQWFLFAAIALVIYGLALRKRLAEQPK